VTWKGAIEVEVSCEVLLIGVGIWGLSLWVRPGSWAFWCWETCRGRLTDKGAMMKWKISRSS
jgi:hypothetical protein